MEGEACGSSRSSGSLKKVLSLIISLNRACPRLRASTWRINSWVSRMWRSSLVILSPSDRSRSKTVRPDFTNSVIALERSTGYGKPFAKTASLGRPLGDQVPKRHEASGSLARCSSRAFSMATLPCRDPSAEVGAEGDPVEGEVRLDVKDGDR